MKILFITTEGFDTPNPNNQMAEVMINDFLDNGFSVHLVQSHRKGINPDIPTSLVDRKGFTVDTIVRKVVDKSNFVARYIDDVKYHFTSLNYWRKEKDVDVIYLQSNPTIYFPMALLKVFKRKIPIVYSIYDVFPGHAYDIGVIKSKILYNIFRWLQKPCYKMATAIAVLSEDMKDVIVKEGAKADDVYIVPAWYDVHTAQEIPVEENKFMRKYKIPQDKFHVQYAGSIGYVFNYKAMIELAKRLKGESDIVIDIIGDGPMKQQFLKETKINGLDNINFFPLQPVAIVPDVYSACDCCVIPLKKGVIGNGTPSKAPILMACNRVIVNAVESWSKYSKMYAVHNMGIAVDVYDYDGLANAVKFLKSHPIEAKQMAINAHKYGEMNFSSTRSTGILMDIFRKYAKH